MSLVYSWAKDYYYDPKQNGSVTSWAKQNRLNIARYPAGEASFWNWEAPSGYMGVSSLDPAAPPPAPAADWMSMEEYLDMCREVGSRPLIGVNYLCGNHAAKFCGTVNESIARAVRQVEFTVKNGFPGAFYYIGNEECQSNCQGFHADRIALHAKAMKAVDPTIKTMFSSNELRPHSLEAVMTQVGVDLLDGVDLHGKWPKGGKDGPSLTFEQYLNEVPLLDHKCGESWRDRLAGLRNVTTSLGRGADFMLMNNEFGLGKPGRYQGGWTRYQKSLALIEFNLELHIAGFDVACMCDRSPSCCCCCCCCLLLLAAACCCLRLVVVVVLLRLLLLLSLVSTHVCGLYHSAGGTTGTVGSARTRQLRSNATQTTSPTIFSYPPATSTMERCFP
jgi:hypothetical protein